MQKLESRHPFNPNEYLFQDSLDAVPYIYTSTQCLQFP